jgi:proline iminopeptidase
VVYPEIEPYDSGLLDVGDGHRIYWEVCGNPAGKPALVLHGGPGTGCSTGLRRYFDPAAYRIVLFDQRNCGRSLPHAADPEADLSTNTTWHVVADIERLRELLAVDSWLVWGGSWGSTLALAYAQTHPANISKLVLGPVTMCRRSEIDWLYGGMRRYFPEQWEPFRAGAGAGVLARDADGSSLATAYDHLMSDTRTAAQAVAMWCGWEDAAASLEVQQHAHQSDPRADFAFARLCAHYFAHLAWLDDEQLLRGAARLAGVPGSLFHGRRDLGSPLSTAWELAQAWPDADLHVLDGAGHWDGDMRAALVEITDRFAVSSGAAPSVTG